MQSGDNNLYEFGEFRLDAREKVLYYAGAPVALKPKAVETLLVLIERAGETVEKNDLINAVWREAFVEENNLSVNIYAIRKVLAARDAGQIYIQTVPRRGFRFVAPVVKRAVVADPKKAAPSAAGEPFDATRDDRNGGVAAANEPPRAAFEKAETPDARGANRLFAYAFAHPHPAMIFLIVLSVVAVGGSLFALRGDSSRRGGEAKSAPAADAAPDAARGTRNIEAYQLYLRGRELWQTRNNQKMTQGVEFFRRAIELDPQFAAPYLGIADSLSMMRNDPEDWRQAEIYAAKALELQPASADAHATRGFIQALNKWDWRAAEASFQTALALDERSGKAHQWYATLLLIERRFTEAERHLKRAVEIEPLSPNYNVDLCELYLLTGRDEEMFAQCRRANEINPDFQYVFYERGFYERHKRYDEAAEAWIKAMARFGTSDAEARRAAWYRAFQKDGFRGWMLADIEGNKKAPDALLGVWNTSVAYAKLGDSEKTLEHLEKAFAGKTFSLPFANARPEFDFLRGDARFQNLLRRVGLPQ